VLANGEKIIITEVGRPGVAFTGTVGPDHIRRFDVFRGQAIVAATDGSGNVSTAYCQ
jgi:hypothetical protein